MGKRSFSSLCAVACFGVALSSSAHAHISLEMASTHRSRSGDGDDQLKDAPCGVAGAPRGTNVYTYQPGEVITIEVNEYIAHPGYFRVAFDNDGDDGFSDPQAIMPENRPCMDGETRCGMTDFCNNETVLLDNIEPHWDSQLTDPAVNRTWQVKLPDVECMNCTLQIIQVMTDPPGHGPYDLMNDVYHQCIDLVLARSGTAETASQTAMNTVPMMDCKPATATPGASAGAGGAASPTAVAGSSGMAGSGGSMAPGPVMVQPSSGGAAGAATAAPPMTGASGGAAVAMSAPLGGSGAPVPALPAPAPAPAAEAGGCQVAGGTPANAATLGIFALASLPFLRRRRHPSA